MSIPLTFFEHVPVAEVVVDGKHRTRFLVDTGAGVTVVSEPLLGTLGHSPEGPPHVGQRMSGQSLSAKLYRVDSLALGRTVRAPATVCGYPLAAFVGADSPIQGILGMPFFDCGALTLDYGGSTLEFEETPPEDAGRTCVPLEVVRNGPEVDLFVALRLPNGRRVRVEVDSGSDQLILHSRFMPELGVSVGGEGVRRVEGSDETGHRYARFFARLPGKVALADATEVGQSDPAVMFQEIIYDGLIGREFLAQGPVTFDLQRDRLLVGPRPSTG